MKRIFTGIAIALFLNACAATNGETYQVRTASICKERPALCRPKACTEVRRDERTGKWFVTC